MTNPLFRQEALDHQGRRSFGDVIVSRPVASSALVAFLGILAVTVVLLLTTLSYDRRETISGYLVPVGDVTRLQAPIAGAVSRVPVTIGDEVLKGQTLLEIVAGPNQKSESIILPAPHGGRIAYMGASPGQDIQAGDVVIVLLPEQRDVRAEFLIPVHMAGRMKVGDPLTVRYRAFPYRQFGTHGATVSAISDVALRPSETNGLIPADKPMVPVTVALLNQEIAAGGKAYPLMPGMRVDADIVIERRTLISSLRLGNW